MVTRNKLAVPGSARVYFQFTTNVATIDTDDANNLV